MEPLEASWTLLERPGASHEEELRPGANEPRAFHGSLTYRQENTVKNEVWTIPWCRTLCFYVCFLTHVAKTQFFACFSRRSAARATIQAGPGKTKSGQNDSKNTGFWKPVASKKRKKSGFCVGRARKPRFLQCILVLLLLKASLELPGAFWKPPGACVASWRLPEGSLEASFGRPEPEKRNPTR